MYQVYNSVAVYNNNESFISSKLLKYFLCVCVISPCNFCAQSMPLVQKVKKNNRREISFVQRATYSFYYQNESHDDLIYMNSRQRKKSKYRT